MHDPMVVAFDIRRPWPKRSSGGRKPAARFRWDVHGTGRRRFLRPGNWSPFVTAFGRNWYFPSLITIWHVEPGGHDSGEICKHWDNDRKRANRRWRWHVHHWHIQIAPLQEVRARLFDRCAECGRKGRPNVSHQWGSRSIGWRKWRSREGLYHAECSSLVSLRRSKESDQALIRHLFAGLAVHLDMSEAELLGLLTDPSKRGLEFGEAYRLTHMLGYERDSSYRLVKSEGRP